MAGNSKLKKLLTTHRDSREVEDWILSLTPLGVAFVFFSVLIVPMDLPNKSLIMVIAAAAGFAGLQSYWIFRGWQKNHGSTMLMGVISLFLTLALVWLYVSQAWPT